MKLRASTASWYRAQVCSFELDPLLGLYLLRQLIEHISLISAQVGGRDRLSKSRGPSEAIHRPHGRGHRRLELSNQRSKFLDAIFHRCTCHEQDPLGSVNPSCDRLASKRLRILHIVGFINHEEGHLDTLGRLHRLKRLVCRHSDATAAAPRQKVAPQLRSVEAIGVEVAVPLCLMGPVHKDARWADDEEVTGTFHA